MTIAQGLTWLGGYEAGVRPVVTLCGLVATGIGSLPGEDTTEWCRIVRGELPEFPHLPELPGRGPGADMIGRTLALLAQVSPDFAAETAPKGWRISSRLGGSPRRLRRGMSWLTEDLDAAEDIWQSYRGLFKIQLAGPWTIAAAVELAGGERMIRDPGACRDLASALGQAAADYVVRVGQRIPGAELVVQFDEPAISPALGGEIPVQSGFGTYRPVAPAVAQAALTTVVAAASAAGAAVAVHCCAAAAPTPMFAAAGAAAISVDLTLRQSDAGLGAWLEAGGVLMAGLDVPATGATDATGPGRQSRSAQPLLELLNRIGIPLERVIDQLVITPRCGLAGFSPDQARSIYRNTVDLARALNEG